MCTYTYSHPQNDRLRSIRTHQVRLAILATLSRDRNPLTQTPNQTSNHSATRSHYLRSKF